MGKAFNFISESETETREFSERLVRFLKRGDIICLFGELGTGKTTFVKGVAKGLKVSPKKVSSPTFVLMNIYNGKKKTLKGEFPLYHLDLYRLEDVQEINQLGLEEFLYGEGVSMIEWADRLKESMPVEYLGVYLEHKNDGKRRILLKGKGQHYQELISKLSV